MKIHIIQIIEFQVRLKYWLLKSKYQIKNLIWEKIKLEIFKMKIRFKFKLNLKNQFQNINTNLLINFYDKMYQSIRKYTINRLYQYQYWVLLIFFKYLDVIFFQLSKYYVNILDQ